MALGCGDQGSPDAPIYRAREWPEREIVRGAAVVAHGLDGEIVRDVGEGRAEWRRLRARVRARAAAKIEDGRRGRLWSLAWPLMAAVLGAVARRRRWGRR